jgi:hypothetical protein
MSDCLLFPICLLLTLAASCAAKGVSVPLFLWNEPQIAALYTLNLLSVVYLPEDGAFASDLQITVLYAQLFTL